MVGSDKGKGSWECFHILGSRDGDSADRSKNTFRPGFAQEVVRRAKLNSVVMRVREAK